MPCRISCYRLQVLMGSASLAGVATQVAGQLHASCTARAVTARSYRSDCGGPVKMPVLPFSRLRRPRSGIGGRLAMPLIWQDALTWRPR
jgi:hypothetical protein